MNNLQGLERKNLSIEYCFTNLSTLTKDDNLIFCPKRYYSPYTTLISNRKSYESKTLKDINGLVENETSFKKELSKE